MAEVEIREEVAQEYEERIQEMEETFARRRRNDVCQSPPAPCYILLTCLV